MFFAAHVIAPGITALQARIMRNRALAVKFYCSTHKIEIVKCVNQFAFTWIKIVLKAFPSTIKFFIKPPFSNLLFLSWSVFRLYRKMAFLMTQFNHTVGKVCSGRI